MPHYFRFLLTLLVGLPLLAQADVYAFIDADGHAHFAPKPLDARYQLFKKGTLPPSRAALAQAESVDTAPYLARRSATGLKTYTPLIEQTARRHGLDPTLLHAIITVESGYHAEAVSPKGAMGLMQVMPDTGARFGLDAAHDVKQNLEAGARYLVFLLARYPQRQDWALAAYNAGEGAVDRHQGIPPFEETQHYVKTVSALWHGAQRKARQERLRQSAPLPETEAS